MDHQSPSGLGGPWTQILLWLARNPFALMQPLSEGLGPKMYRKSTPRARLTKNNKRCHVQSRRASERALHQYWKEFPCHFLEKHSLLPWARGCHLIFTPVRTDFSWNYWSGKKRVCLLGRAVRQIDECTSAPSGISQGAFWMGLWVTPQRWRRWVGYQIPTSFREENRERLLWAGKRSSTAFGSFMRRGWAMPPLWLGEVCHEG